MVPRRNRILVRTQPKANTRWKWTGFAGKTLWEWLQLLIIPFVIATGGFWFTAQQSQANIQIAADQQQETTLEAYLDRMSGLLLDKKLDQAKSGDETAIVAQAQTLYST